ncbi:MAG: Gx transporter family protein [Gammaproteobacteria bacterium]
MTASTSDRLIAGFAGLAIAIHLLEAAFPSPLPGVKPGLANVVTLVVLLRYGWAAAAWVAALRVLAGSLLLGSLMSPGFFLSASGAAAALLALWAGVHLPGKGLSAIGLGVLAAMAHMAAQIVVAFFLFIGHPAILNLVPPLMTAALVFGLVSGIIASTVLDILDRQPSPT